MFSVKRIFTPYIRKIIGVKAVGKGAEVALENVETGAKRTLKALE